MKLSLQLQMSATSEQKEILLSTMAQFNNAASFAATIGFKAGVFSQIGIHKLAYREIREKFGLSAQMAVRAIGKATEAFASLRAKSRNECPVFKPHGAITYDQRILTFKGNNKVNLWTLSGRMMLPIIYGKYQEERFGYIKGQSDLVYRDGKFFLVATIELQDKMTTVAKDFLGVDFGIINIATDSDGQIHSGESIEHARHRHHENRRRFQKRRSKGAKKRLKRLSGKESRFRKHENHCISKALVQKAKDTDRGIALENLKGISMSATVRAKDRNRHASWGFDQLRRFIEYKSKLAGVPIVLVDPRNTSRTCNACGNCEKANRKSQSAFICKQCNYSQNADVNAARNIRDRANSKVASKLEINDPGLNPGEINRKAIAL